LFGRVASLKEQALAQYLATREAAQAAQISLVATIAQGWLALLTDEDMLRAATQTLATREASLKLVELKVRHGASSDLEWRLAQTLTESARVTLAQQQRQRALDENALTWCWVKRYRRRPRPFCRPTQLAAPCPLRLLA